jgi:signal transduction histidine kinase
MSLTNRLSVFFLAALGVVLAGFSLALYALAQEHLLARSDHRLDSAMQTLVAAIEIHPGDVEWEPLERRITMGEDPGLDQLRWTVHTAHGRLVDCSRNLEQAPGTTDDGWRLSARRVRAGNFQAEPLEVRATPRVGSFADVFPAGQVPGTVALPNDRTFHGDELVLTVAIAEAPVAAILRRLALSMAVISAAVWLAAALCGRWLCRRALSPVIRMAASARELRRSAECHFLDVAPTGDELQDLGTAFNEALADLRESLERQRRFTGDASHQLRTPLTALLASVEIALRKERGSEEYRRVLGVVQRRGSDLKQIIEALLFLARPETESRPPNPETVDLANWCALKIAGWDHHERAADIRLDAQAVPITLRTHPALLGQALDNLIDNALKYSAADTPVIVGIEADWDSVSIAVADEGGGIAPEELSRIFEPFFRTNAARWDGKPGVGLGLTVAQRLAAILGARIEVESEPGKGSRFRIILKRNSINRETGQVRELDEVGRDVTEQGK